MQGWNQECKFEYFGCQSSIIEKSIVNVEAILQLLVQETLSMINPSRVLISTLGML